jgi:DNA helicase-2/ATP-dependent DNA helicase PcrA
VRDFGRLEQPWPTICTFHSLCLRILRHYAQAVGLPHNFSIFDSSDQTKLVKEALKALDLSSTNFPPGTVHGAISDAKNKLLSPQQYAANVRDFYGRTVARVYVKYQDLLRQNNALDFDDLLLRTAQAFRDHPDVLAELQERWQYILIDEYQDTNHAQYVIAHALAMKHRNICVVGDPDQCLSPGTAVSTPRGPQAIETLREGDRVTSGSGWGATTEMAIEKVMKRRFKGRLVRIRTEDGHELRGTPNHLAFAKLRSDPRLHYTYLMWKRGVGYRIGTTRGVRTSKDREICSGLQVRANQEVADAMWVLHSSRSAAECRFYEHLYSVRYGIPTMVFFVRGRRMDMTQDWVDRLYMEVDSHAGAARLMADLHLDRRYPHHRPGGVTRSGAGADHAATVSGGAWSRRHVLFTVFGDGRAFSLKPWHEHRVQLVTSDPGLRAAAAAQFRVRDGVRGTWRIETSRKDYEGGLTLARDITALAQDMEVVPRARLTRHKPFLFMPLSHIHAGMLVPVCRNGEIFECAVESVEWEDYDGPVYDLSVPHTRNYVANGVVVHNSIYAWRGADIKNILEFERDYPDAKVVRLEQNYRSTKTILAVASKLIANNLQRKDKGLWTENGQGEPAELYLCQDEHDEAQVVMRRLKELNEKQGIAWSQMAIFYRMNSLSRVMEEALFKAKMPYQIARGVEFYNRREIKDVLAYLRVVANPSDEVSLGRIVNVPPRGLGEGAIEKIQAYAVGHGMSLFEAMGDAGKVTGLTTRAVNSAKAFVGMVRRWREIAGLGPPEEANVERPTSNAERRSGGAGDGELSFEPAQPKGDVQTLMENVVRTSGYEDLLKKLDKEKEEGERASDNVGELINAAAEFDREQPEGTLHDYLAQVSLVSDADHLRGAGGAVTLMTLHAAKGLEFPVVAMIGLEDGILPHSRARDNVNELEEERRLCFVGITRAQQYLILSKAQTRAFRGSDQRTITSPFLNEMPQEFFRITDRTGLKGLGRDEADDDGGWGRSEGYRNKSDAGSEFRRGQMVRHPTFGIGRIADVSNAGQHTRAVVEFNTVGRKTLILQYARLEAVG